MIMNRLQMDQYVLLIFESEVSRAFPNRKSLRGVLNWASVCHGCQQ